jgi:hypothetical protein
MTRLALAAASLLVGLAIAGPTQAGSLGQYLDLDEGDFEVSELSSDLGRMVRSPDRAFTDLKRALGQRSELGAAKQFMDEDDDEMPIRVQPRQNRSMVASSKAVKRSVTQEKSSEPLMAEPSSSTLSQQPKAGSLNCIRFVPSASTTISVDCAD